MEKTEHIDNPYDERYPASYQILAALVDKLLENGYSEEDCGKFLEGNMYRVMSQAWKQASDLFTR